MRTFAIILLAIFIIIWLSIKIIGLFIITLFFLFKLGGALLFIFLLYIIFRPRK